jgi:Domain of unknown function (DUF4136)
MHLFSRLLLLTALSLSLSACQSSKVTTDYDTDADFSHFKYYDWHEENSGGEEGFDPLIVERIKEAVKTELAKAAFSPASETNKATVLVRYYVATQTRNEEPGSSASIGFGHAGGHSGVGLSFSFPLGGGTGDSTVVKEALIIVDLLSPEDQKLKWRGSNQLSISDQSPAEITAMINAAVAEIFSFYPPGSKPE